ncbi:transmembrane protein 200B [Columba livia]|uniref:Transmembrane protein 200B n=1 Tax=Columba livia TaxID=8932 RepID=A0A2I0LS08_COLLI|nr:transmembrane protein 200B [Columba livia]
MTAESTKTNGPVRELETGGTKPPVPPAPPRRRGRRLRRKSPPEVPVKGQLRMRSPSGAFVMVGISVVLVGMTIAVVGYWPHRGPSGTGASVGNTSIVGDMRREVAAGRHVPHSEKLKLIGPVIMGIGLFIFICANTMLYENRDMETRRLMQKGLYSMAGGLPEGTGPGDGHCQRGDGQPVPQASTECVEGCYQVDLSCQPCLGPDGKWSNCYGSNRLQTTAELLRHPAASPAASLLSLRSGASAEANLSLSHRAGAECLISSAVGALALPVIKLNNCLLDAAAQWPGKKAEEAPAGPLAEALQLSQAPLSSGANIMPGGQDHGGGGHVIINVDGGCPSVELSLDAQLHTPGHSKSLDLGRPGGLLVAPMKDRKNRSWPRLDHLSLVGYAKLESAGESSDRLLEPSKPRPRAPAQLLGRGDGAGGHAGLMSLWPLGTVTLLSVIPAPSTHQRP